MSAKPLFLYLASAALDESTLALLEAAGYVPVPVHSFDSVKIAEPVWIGQGSALAKAAFETVSAAGYDSVRADFGKRIAAHLSTETPK